MVTEATAFDETVKMFLDKMDLEETLVILTADHSHAFAIQGYPPLNNPILGSLKNVTTLVYSAGPGFQTKKAIPPENANKNFPGYDYPAVTNTTQGRHGGEDVLIPANGPMAHLFQGIRMQSYIGHVMQYASGTGLYREKGDKTASFSPSTQMNPVFLGLVLRPECKISGEADVPRWYTRLTAGPPTAECTTVCFPRVTSAGVP